MHDVSHDSTNNLKYVHDMLAQLKAVSGSKADSLLPYLIDMARMEAAVEIRRQQGDAGDHSKSDTVPSK